jgi:hypothetical protein
MSIYFSLFADCGWNINSDFNFAHPGRDQYTSICRFSIRVAAVLSVARSAFARRNAITQACFEEIAPALLQEVATAATASSRS